MALRRFGADQTSNEVVRLPANAIRRIIAKLVVRVGQDQQVEILVGPDQRMRCDVPPDIRSTLNALVLARQGVGNEEEQVHGRADN